jgi:hemolysin activation/secretion protein
MKLGSGRVSGRALILAAMIAGLSDAGLFLTPAFAQTLPPNLPNIPQVSPLEHIQPVTPPRLNAGLPDFTPLNAAGAMPNIAIFVHSVAIVGATAFPAARLLQLAPGLAGQTVPLARLEADRLAMVNLYRGQGFVLTTVSLEINANGDVRFIITEGRIVAVKLSADIGPVGTLILNFLNHVTEERPIREATLERWLLLCDQIPGVSVHAVLQSDSTDPGALTLVAEVAKQTVAALATTDNRSLSDTGPSEVLGVVDINSVTALGDQTELSMFHASGGTDNFGQAAESFFIGNNGLRVRLYAGYGEANPGGVLREVAYHSSTTVFGAQLSYPVLLRRNESLTASLRFDGAENAIDTAGLRASYDSLRVARGTVEEAWQDNWLGDSRDALSLVNLLISQGLPILGSSRNNRDSPPAGRADEQFDFYKLFAAASRTQNLLEPLPNTTIALRLEAGGQFTTDVLPSAEQFCLGGARYTRGFYACQEVGDSAAYATAELQLNTGYSFDLFAQEIDLGAQLYGFYDWGETFSNLKTDLNHRLASAGAGARFALTRNLEADVEFDERLTTQLEPPDTGALPLAKTAVYFGVTARY